MNLKKVAGGLPGMAAPANEGQKRRKPTLNH